MVKSDKDTNQNWAVYPRHAMRNPTRGYSEYYSEICLALEQDDLVIMEISTLVIQQQQMQLQDFLPASRRDGDVKVPFLLRYRSSKSFIMTTVSVAIFTVSGVVSIDDFD